MRLKVLTIVLVILSSVLATSVILEKTSDFNQFDRGMSAMFCAVNLIQNARWSEEMAVKFCVCAAKEAKDKVTPLTHEQQRKCVNQMTKEIRDSGNSI